MGEDSHDLAHSQGRFLGPAGQNGCSRWGPRGANPESCVRLAAPGVTSLRHGDTGRVVVARAAPLAPLVLFAPPPPGSTECPASTKSFAWLMRLSGLGAPGADVRDTHHREALARVLLSTADVSTAHSDPR